VKTNSRKLSVKCFDLFFRFFANILLLYFTIVWPVYLAIAFFWSCTVHTCWTSKGYLMVMTAYRGCLDLSVCLSVRYFARFSALEWRVARWRPGNRRGDVSMSIRDDADCRWWRWRKKSVAAAAAGRGVGSSTEEVQAKLVSRQCDPPATDIVRFQLSPTPPLCWRCIRDKSHYDGLRHKMTTIAVPAGL